MWGLIHGVERLGALLLLIALAPPLLLAAAVICVLSRRSPLVGHLRVGRDGVPFRMLKLRTMWNSPGRRRSLVEFVNEEPGPDRKRLNDPRVSGRVARFLRTCSIDELPQLLHVVTGRMSLVGPRPLTKTELFTHYGPDAAEVLKLKPGITGLWQVMGRSRLTYRQRKRLDLFYVRKRSPGLYGWVLARSIPRVLSGRDSW